MVVSFSDLNFESILTKGQRRKLNALRKSVGDEIGTQAFFAWLFSYEAPGTTADANAALIVDTLWPLVQQGTLSIRAAATCSGAGAGASSSSRHGRSHGRRAAAPAAARSG